METNVTGLRSIVRSVARWAIVADESDDDLWQCAGCGAVYAERTEAPELECPRCLEER